MQPAFQPGATGFSGREFSCSSALAGAGALLVHQLSSGPKSVVPTVPLPIADPVVATVNDQLVTAAEYRLVMERKVALVYSYFKEHQNLDDHLGYWSERLQERTVLWPSCGK